MMVKLSAENSTEKQTPLLLNDTDIWHIEMCLSGIGHLSRHCKYTLNGNTCNTDHQHNLLN